MGKQDLYLNCLKGQLDVYRRGTFNRWETVAVMATCIDFYMRELPETEREKDGVRNAAAVPALALKEPLNADDKVLQELYAEATTFWAAGYGSLRLIK
jgi:hypothetical protein